MMSLYHGWGWQPPQTASHTHIWHIQSVWAHWYAVYGHKVVAIHSYTHTIWLGFGVLGHLGSQNDVIISWLRLIATSNWSPTFILDIYKSLNTLICCPWAYGSSLKQLYPHYLAQNLGFWLTCGVKTIALCHWWGWQPHQIASHIHIRHIKSVWEHWYAVYGHSAAALNNYTHLTWLRFWGTGSFVLVESKLWHNVIVEADSQLKLHPTSILDV